VQRSFHALSHRVRAAAPDDGEGTATAAETRAEMRVVAMVGFDGVQVLDVTGPLEVFARASRVLVEQGIVDADVYRVMLVGTNAGPIRSSSGLTLVAECSLRDLPGVDTLLVSGGVGTEEALKDRILVDWLRQAAPLTRRYGSVCTGAFLLARAGLLDGRRVTTHWARIAQLAAMAPTARVEQDAIFVQDEGLWTSAGVTAGMDMALAMVEADWGKRIALEVAHQLVMYLKRTGASSQLSVPLEAQARALDSPVGRIAGWIISNLDQDLSVNVLAEQMSMSPRHFTRSFGEVFGMTPARFVEKVCLEAAQQLLASGDTSVEIVAERCGFGSAETLRRVFIRRIGVGPAAYRMRMRRESGRTS
jgi:transcriptional regulator GlxA family with amidase domain